MEQTLQPWYDESEDTSIEDLKQYFAGRLEYLDSLWGE